MATLTSKYSVGDLVYRAGTMTKVFMRDCPDCQGSKQWDAISPAGKQYQFACPRCSASYQSERDLDLKYTQFVASVQPLTIGSIRVDTHDERPISYMCVETGVGSGSIHYEEDLFPTEDEARRAAEQKAAAQNISTEWVVKQYDRTLKLSDYQLSDATMKSARDMKIRHEVDLQLLFDDLRNCETIEDVQKTLEDFSFREAA